MAQTSAYFGTGAYPPVEHPEIRGCVLERGPVVVYKEKDRYALYIAGHTHYSACIGHTPLTEKGYGLAVRTAIACARYPEQTRKMVGLSVSP